MKKSSSIDAILALVIIVLLMISLLTMNIGYIGLYPTSYHGSFPISDFLLTYFYSWDLYLLHEFSWWSHIILVLIFLNELPYSKHFHVIMSIPNVYFSNIENLGKIIIEKVYKKFEITLDWEIKIIGDLVN